MFNPVLRNQGNDRMVYSTSIGFRIVFFCIALILVFSIGSVSGGSFFSRLNVFSVLIIAICLFASLWVERWTFDKRANLFKKNVGLLFAYSRKEAPLDSLRRVVVREHGEKDVDRSKVLRWPTRKTAVLSVVDRDEKVYRLDIVSGGSVQEIRKSAQRISTFCAIPLEDDAKIEGSGGN